MRKIRLQFTNDQFTAFLNLLSEFAVYRIAGKAVSKTGKLTIATIVVLYQRISSRAFVVNKKGVLSVSLSLPECFAISIMFPHSDATEPLHVAVRVYVLDTIERQLP